MNVIILKLLCFLTIFLNIHCFLYSLSIEHKHRNLISRLKCKSNDIPITNETTQSINTAYEWGKSYIGGTDVCGSKCNNDPFDNKEQDINNNIDPWIAIKKRIDEITEINKLKYIEENKSNSIATNNTNSSSNSKPYLTKTEPGRWP